MSNVDTVKEIYAAFGRGDIGAIIDKLDDQVEWDVEHITDTALHQRAAKGE